MAATGLVQICLPVFADPIVVSSGYGTYCLAECVEAMSAGGGGQLQLLGAKTEVELVRDADGAWPVFNAGQAAELEMNVPGLYFWEARCGDETYVLYVGKATVSVADRHYRRVRAGHSNVLTLSASLQDLQGYRIYLVWYPTAWSALTEAYVLSVLMLPANSSDQLVPWTFHPLHDPAVLQKYLHEVYTTVNLDAAKALAATMVAKLFKEATDPNIPNEVLIECDNALDVVDSIDSWDGIAAKDDILAVSSRLKIIRARCLLSPPAVAKLVSAIGEAPTRPDFHQILNDALITVPPHELNKIVDRAEATSVMTELTGRLNLLLGRA